MSIPTITSVSPAVGESKGYNLVHIVGTNFKLPDTPPDGYCGGEQQRTVSVKFGSETCEWAYAASSTLILARVPEYRGDPAVEFPLELSVRVANIDSTGAEIPTENVTKTKAYTLKRPDLAAESYFQSVIRAFQKVFKRHVLADTFVTSSIVAADEHYTDKRKTVTAPAIYLIGPTTRVNREYSSNREDEIESGDGWYRTMAPTAYDFSFQLAIYANSSRHLSSLSQAVILMFRDVVDVRVYDDPVAGSGTYKDYEIEMEWEFSPSHDDVPNSSDLFKSTASVMIRGVQVDDNMVIEEGMKIDDVALETEGE